MATGYPVCSFGELHLKCPENVTLEIHTVKYICIYNLHKREGLPTNKNFIQTHRLLASAFIRGLYIGFIKPLMISYYAVLRGPRATNYVTSK